MGIYHRAAIASRGSEGVQNVLNTSLFILMRLDGLIPFMSTDVLTGISQNRLIPLGPIAQGDTT